MSGVSVPNTLHASTDPPLRTRPPLPVTCAVARWASQEVILRACWWAGTTFSFGWRSRSFRRASNSRDLRRRQGVCVLLGCVGKPRVLIDARPRVILHRVPPTEPARKKAAKFCEFRDIAEISRPFIFVGSSLAPQNFNYTPYLSYTPAQKLTIIRTGPKK